MIPKWLLWTVLIVCVFYSTPLPAKAQGEFIDASGRKVSIAHRVDRVICSGAGALRLLTYLQAQDRVVAVDSIEKRKTRFDARPYVLANPQLKKYPLFGEFRGFDHPELILSLNPQPQVIFKTYATMGHDPVELAQKTGIPVVVLEYGDLFTQRHDLYQSFRIMGQILNKPQRARKVVDFFESCIRDLKQRTQGVPENSRKSCFVGGIAFKGPHGFQSTEPGYPPFSFVNAKNVAYDASAVGKTLRHSNVAKEKLLEWDPDILLLDLSTLQMGDKAGGWHELKTDPAYRSLKAVKNSSVYGVLPYNWYTQNFGSILANAYFIGKILYPERFRDIDPQQKADEIYLFLVGKPVFKAMDEAFGNLVFKQIPLNREDP
jgi:iron complex transport system substrate-binding protein